MSAAKRTLLEKRLRGRVNPAAAGRSIPRRGNVAAAPLSYAQKRVWFFQQLDPESPLYNIPAAFHLQGRLNQDALQKALETIVRRHEVLRTRFTSEAGSPHQIVTAPPADFPLSIVDLRHCPPARREAETDRLLQAGAVQPFDLARDLMLRATLIELGPMDHLLAINTHHIASDGWSMGVFSRELAELYQAFDTGHAPSLPDLPVQYADYALWQHGSLCDDALDGMLTYWRRQLADAPALLELPIDRPRNPTQTFQGRWQWQALPQSLADALKELSQHQGVTLFMTLLAAFKTLLHRYTQVEDILVGAPVAGRNQIEIENLIGFFVNALVLRTDLSGDPSFCELLHRVRDVTLGALAHQSLPFDRLVQELRPERTTSHAPLVQVLFVFQNDPLRGFKLPGLKLTPLPVDKVDTGTAKFDLTFQVGENGQGLVVAAEYNTDLFEH
ncbi:MAG TPA: condensation domain-containing protein, partial [Verrucomicrobiae bacterium]|nr:condensation domain-containing protein [Verrucomicrobiae bacterium]